MAKRWGMSVVLGVTLVTSTVAEARPAMPNLLAAGEIAPAPTGYIEMCAVTPETCAAQTAAGSAVVPKTDRALMRLAKRINRRVNRHVRWQADIAEHWGRPSGEKHAVGDCEDFAIEKRIELVAAGFPAQQLHFAVGFLPEAGLHTVLIAEIGGRDIVLDSRTPWTMPWFETPYIWVLRQSDNDPSVWRNTIALSQPGTASNT